MSPKFPSFHLVGAPRSQRAGAARTAVKGRADGLVRESTNLSAAIAQSAVGPEVLVLLDGTLEDFESALATLDERGGPRWAVVPPSREDYEQSAVCDDAWEPTLLARSISFAVSLLALRRDNARLAGDLHTVARRLAHDLRTPLNSISTANEALAAVAAGTEPAPTLHRAISVAVDEMGDLIGRVAPVLLASVRPGTPQSVDMEEIVWNAREKLDARIRSAGATIVSPEKWPVVIGVPSWLELIWTNLLSNSVEHGGATPRIELGWKRADARAYFWIRDSGAGVAIAKQAHLFHPFSRLNELNAPWGYGLSLVQRLIELHDGTTGYTPDPVRGGLFYFTLPDQK